MLIAGKDAKKKKKQIQYPQNHLEFQWNTPKPISKMFPKKNLEAWTPHQNPKNLQLKSSACWMSSNS